MSQESWERIVALFEAALEREGDDRERFLRELEEREPELRRQVEAMLIADGGVYPVLDGMPRFRAADQGSPTWEGREVGPYRVLREVGRGGMGTVYLAEREDLDRRVALKFVAGGQASAPRLDRFLYERFVLAQLEHPLIARLYDAGVTPDGTPWLAMEYVDGLRIDRWCDERRLDVRARLRLMEQVCDAVAYAHRNLVVHRDLKPSNILVTAAGEPRLVDFGIAKLLDDSRLDPALTQTGVHPLTPRYASPEQLAGGTLTTASDVYQLGVLLYELLTGTPPFAEDRQPIRGAAAATEAPVTPPSRALGRRGRKRETGDAASAEIAAARGTTSERLRHALQGDVDAIVLMALRSEPERRYPSALEVAEDIRRHLSGRPIVARPDTLSYRTSRFVRRNRLAVAAAGVLAVNLVGATVVTSSQARRAAEERDRATAEAAKSEQVVNFLTDIFTASHPFEALGEELTAAELLARGTQRLREPEELNAQPEVRAELLDVLGRVYRDLGRRAEAQPLLEEALAIRRGYLDPGDPELAESLTSLGNLMLYNDRPVEARPLLEEALAIHRLAAEPSADELASALHNLASVHGILGSNDTAEVYFREAVAMRRGIEGLEENYAGTLGGLGALLSRAGKLEAADSFHAQALAIQREILSPNHPQIANSLSSIGLLKLRQEDPAGAEPYLRESLEIRQAVLGSHPQVAGAMHNLASCLRRMERFEEAEALLRESLAMKRELITGDHTTFATSLNSLGLVLQKRGQYAEAEAHMTEAIAMARRLRGDDHPELPIYLHNLAELQENLGDPAAALKSHTEALSIRRERLGPQHPLTLESESAVAGATADAGAVEDERGVP